MYRLWPLGSHVILNLPHFQPIRSSDFAAQQISQSENVAEAEKCATYSKIQLTLQKTRFSHSPGLAKGGWNVEVLASNFRASMKSWIACHISFLWLQSPSFN